VGDAPTDPDGFVAVNAQFFIAGTSEFSLARVGVPHSTEQSGLRGEGAALVDLLGGLAYGEFSAFDRLVADARMAPTLAGRTQMSAMATFEFGHYELLAARLRELGADPVEAMEPFVESLEEFHARTVPSTWLEGVVKAYVGDGMAADFYREVASFVDPATRALIEDVLTDGGRAEFARSEVAAALREDPNVAGALALWARRLVGEAISEMQHVLAERDPLMELFVAGVGDMSGIARLVTRITERHEQRMLELGFKS
jgi:hypothetical protein